MELRYVLFLQKLFDLPDLVCLAAISLPGTVDGGCRQNAEISILQVPCDQFTAGPRHAHGMKKQDGRVLFIAKCFKLHRVLSA